MSGDKGIGTRGQVLDRDKGTGTLSHERYQLQDSGTLSCVC